MLAILYTLIRKMDDVVSRCREQLGSFRIRELKDVLSRLGLPKQGKKQVLMDKIMGVLVPVDKTTTNQKGLGRSSNKPVVSKEEAANVIDDIYRKLRGLGAPDLASSGKKDVAAAAAAAASSSVARSEEQDEAAVWGEAKTRCPCGVSRDMGMMIQCDDPKCGVWQHISCVVIPEKPVEGVDPEVPPQYYCELCRINRSDPFCVTLHSPLLSAKLSTSSAKTDGSNPLQNVEKTFQLSMADRDLLHRVNHDLQVWCVLLNDKVPFRMHWPAYAELRVNGVLVRVTNRPGQQLLGANGRDEGPGVTTYTREGLNRISLCAYDARPFCIGVRVIRRLTLQQVLALIPDVSKGEDFEEALTRVRRCIHGGGQGAADDGDDSDLEVVAESIPVNLRCPMSGSRIKVAGRFRPCLHMGCFDLNTFVELNQRARKWQCPICLKNYCLENLIIDPFFNCVTTALKGHGEDVTEVEMKADGLWRPKIEGEKFREPWRLPDGSIVVANGGLKVAQQSTPLAAVKVEEGLSSAEKGSLLLGMKRSVDGLWSVKGVKRLNGWASNNMAGPSQKSKPTIITRSTSATDSNDEENGEDGERSVNQEPSEKDTEDLPYFGKDAEDVNVEENEVTFQPRSGVVSFAHNSKSGGGEPNTGDVIILSDTDEEGDVIVGSSGASAYGGSDTLGPAGSIKPTSPDMETEEIPEDQYLVTLSRPYPASTSTVGRLPASIVESKVGAPNVVPLETPGFWSIPLGYFGGGSDPPSAVVNGHRSTPVRPTAVQAVVGTGFGLSPQNHQRDNASRATSWRFARSPPLYLNSDGNVASTDGGSGVSPRDAPLRLFLPHQPARAQVQPALRESVGPQIEEVDNSWFSLSLGGNESILNTPRPSVPGSSKRSMHRAATQARSGLDSLASTASEVLLGMTANGARSPPLGPGPNVQSVTPYSSPVDSLSPIPNSPAHARGDTLSPVHVIPAAHFRSPSQILRHRHHFRVDSDSE